MSGNICGLVSLPPLSRLSLNYFYLLSQSVLTYNAGNKVTLCFESLSIQIVNVSPGIHRVILVFLLMPHVEWLTDQFCYRKFQVFFIL